ncbi:hypothetical protein [Saccharibacillus sacchari]|uniref:Uncharacterized protein n=1 Tax=Saccharibacillus sacchari TaxID=456493 RepID=A0ACC6PHD1_9BACL
MLLFAVLTTCLLVVALMLIVARKVPKKFVLPLLASAMALRLAAALPIVAGLGALANWVHTL